MALTRRSRPRRATRRVPRRMPFGDWPFEWRYLRISQILSDDGSINQGARLGQW
jgi:hypothetical protein